MLQAGTLSHAEDSQVHQDGGDALPAIFRPGIDTVMEEVCTTAGTQLWVSRQVVLMAVHAGQLAGATEPFSCPGGSSSWTMTKAGALAAACSLRQII